MKNIINKIVLLTLCLTLITASAAAQTNGAPQQADRTPASATKQVRIGLAGVKTGAVGKEINAQELSGAVGSLLSEYLKGSSVELVPLEAQTAAGLDAEAREKQCLYVLYAQVSHKKGGGGFGKMFAQVAPALSMVVPVAGVAGMIIGSVASSAATVAANASSNVKAKDEITLDIKLQNGAAVAMTKQYKAKAKTGGEDIISPLIEQAAQAVIDASKG